MDLFTVCIGSAVCVATAAILYYISVHSFKEKTYEEVLAEQRKFADSLLSKSNEKTVTKEAKKPKKVVKKKQAPTQHSEEKLHVEFEPDTEIIPEEPTAAAQHGEKEKKRDKKVKPSILRNRDHSTEQAFDPDVDSINHFMEHPPKDEAELKKPGKSGNKKNPKPVVEEKIVAVEVPVVEPVAVKEVAFTCGVNTSAPAQPQPSTPKKQKRKNVKGDAVDGGEDLLLQLGGTEKLLSALRSMPFTSAELQTTIEVLLNRQQEEAAGAVDSEWMERGGRLDPIGALRKQLTDKDKALAEEKEEKQVYQNKLRTLGAEMASERARDAAARKQLEETLARKAGEVQMLTTRLQQSADQHLAEMAALRAQVKTQQASEDHVRQLQRLQEEKVQLEARCSAAQQKTQDLVGRIQQLDELLRHKDAQMEEFSAQSSTQMGLMAAQLQEMEAARNGQNLELQREIVQLREALQASENQAMHAVHEARSRLEETERTKQLLEDRITKVDRDLLMERSIAAQKEAEVRQELQRLCLENQSLHLQLSSTTETRRDDDMKWEALLRDKEAKLEEQRIQAAELQKELERLQSETQNLSQQLNNAAKFQQEQTEALRAKEEELAAQKSKNNELRDKNYKAMDALAGAEKSLVELKKSVSSTPNPVEVHRSIGSGLRKVFPDLKLDDSSSSASWADSLASQLSESVKRLQEEEQSKALAQVQHYKTVLSQTEQLLNRLQSQVEAEEAAWKAKVSRLDADLSAVVQEKDFWMEQCQNQQQQQEQNARSGASDSAADLQARIESLSKEKENILRDAENERLAARQLQGQLEALQSSLDEERQTVQQLRDQLDQTKAELAAVKVGSLGFMVGWAKGSTTIDTNSARRNSLDPDFTHKEGSSPFSQVTTKSPTTNGSNGNGSESPFEEVASHFAS